jgi:hypothetical protein
MTIFSNEILAKESNTSNEEGMYKEVKRDVEG